MAGHAGKVPAPLEAMRTLQSFQDRLGPRIARGDVLVWHNGGPLGFVALNGAELEQLHLATRAHGSGAASQLIRAAEATLHQRGIITAHLICIPDNARALAFYAKHGWREVARGPETVETLAGPFDLLCCRLEKPLAPAPRP